MKLNEIATHVRIEDKGRPYYYWVSVKNPNKAKAAGMKKHRKAMGMVSDGDMTVSIVGASGEKVTEAAIVSPEMNAEIERRIVALPRELQMPVQDALEVLRDADKPLTLAEWSETIRSMYGDPEMPLMDVLKTAVKEFPIVVQRIAPKTYSWQVIASSAADDADDDPMFSAAVDTSIGLQQRAMAIIQHEHGQFTAEDLKQRLGPKSIGQRVIDAFVDNFIESFRGKLTKNGDVYTMKMEPRNTRDDNMQMLRDIVNKPQ